MTDHLRVAPRRTVTIDGRTLSFRDNEQGEPILCLHDMFGSADSWGPSWSSLPGRRLVAWDMPGYGDSDPWPDDAPAPADYADLCIALMDKLALDPAHLIGHGAGAVIAAHLAARHGERFRSLTLISPLVGATERLPEPDGDVASFAGVQAKRLVGPQNPPSVVREVERIMAAASPQGFRAAAALVAHEGVDADLQAVRLDAVVIGGESDPLVDTAACERVMKLLPKGDLRTAASVGHFISLERPDRFHDMIGVLLELN